MIVDHDNLKFTNMTNNNLYTFVGRISFLLRAVTDEYRLNPVGLLINISAFLQGFFIIRIFGVVDQYSHSTVNFVTAQDQINEFFKYERCKNLIQREHPSNVQLPTTRQGLHSIPNIPVKESGGFLDRTKGSLLFYLTTSIHLLLGMNIKEGLFNNY